MSFFDDFQRIAIGRSIPSLTEAVGKSPAGYKANKIARKNKLDALRKAPATAKAKGNKAAMKRLTGPTRKPYSEGSLGDNKEIAMTIAQQMGGKMKAMLGATLMAVENGLQIKWPNKKRSLGNICVVTLRPDDTYDMEFFNGAKSVKKFEGLYAEDLIPTFESHTGWYLRM